jgi:hypothetical protein
MIAPINRLEQTYVSRGSIEFPFDRGIERYRTGASLEDLRGEGAAGHWPRKPVSHPGDARDYLLPAIAESRAELI